MALRCVCGAEPFVYIRKSAGCQSMWDRKEIKKKAREVLKNHYWESVVVFMVPLLIGAAGQLMMYARGALHLPFMAAGILFSIIAGLPLRAGCAVYALHNREDRAEPADLVSAFRQGYFHKLAVMFVFQGLVILWSLLLIIPGVIFAYHYRLVPYLLADDPEIGVRDALKKSKEMMDGQKKAAFLLDLSTFGWVLLSTLTAGVAGIFWTKPYLEQIGAELYAALKKDSAFPASGEGTAPAAAEIPEGDRGADAGEAGFWAEDDYEDEADLYYEPLEDEDSDTPEAEDYYEEAEDDGLVMYEEAESDDENEQMTDNAVSLAADDRFAEEDSAEKSTESSESKNAEDKEQEGFLDDTVSIPVHLIDFEVPEDVEEEEEQAQESFLDDTVSIPVRLIDFEVDDEI